MINKPLTNSIVDYDEKWINQFEEEAEQLSSCFFEDVKIHHIGSTSIKGMSAKPEIDILIVLPLFINLESIQYKIEALSYIRGGNLSKGHHFYKKEKNGIRTHKLHICNQGHSTIHQNMVFKKHIENNNDDFIAYCNLKKQLVANRLSMAEYLHGKNPFIKNILSQYNET